MMDLWMQNQKSFYHHADPNISVPNGGILMMRSKSTLAVIDQLERTGQLNTLMEDKNQFEDKRTQKKWQAIVAQAKLNM